MKPLTTILLCTGLITLGLGASSASAQHNRNYRVVDNIGHNGINVVSDRTNPFKLGLITLYGESYAVQRDSTSALGFALYPYDKLREIISEQDKTVWLEVQNPNDIYIARQLKVNGRPANQVTLMTTGKYAINARREELEETDNIGAQRTKSPEYAIKTLVVNGQETFWPFWDNRDSNKLPVLTIPRKGNTIVICPQGNISLYNPGQIFEWINQTQARKELEASRTGEIQSIQ